LDPVIDTWNIHNRINLYLLDGIQPEAFAADLAGKGRSVGEQFMHIHNVRLQWLQASSPDLMANLVKLEKEQATDSVLLRSSLEASGSTIATLLERGIAAGGKIKGFKPHATAFLGYLISHESYHRAEIGIILAQAGFKLDQKIAYGQWEWGSR
jgi:uncharacterized damage-inducible protein DinB